MKRLRAADILIQSLRTLGTKHIFSLSGNQIMPVYDAWIDSELELLHVRHEAAAVHMADAWGRLTGMPGVALLAAGPGFANSLSASYVAKMAESPVVVLSGHAPLASQGRGVFQEMPQVTMGAAVAKASWLVRKPDSIGHDLRRAFQIATEGRPGPVHLGLPADLLAVEVDEAEIARVPVRNKQLGEGSDAAALDTIWRSINNAARPLILAGPAVMRSAAFRQATGPLGEAGVPLIGMESPRGVFDPALGRFADILAEADLLILLGKKLDFTLRLGWPPFVADVARLLQVDADAEVLSLTERNAGDRLEIVDLVNGDPVNALSQLAQSTRPSHPDATEWAAKVAEALAFQPPEWQQYQSAVGEALFSVEVGRIIHDYLAGSEDSVLVSDGGEFGQWMQACVRTPHQIINGTSGAIGNAIPFAIAARLAFPHSRIVSCTGDGAFGFHPFEFDTAIRHDVPFIAVIGNDARWNAEYQIQLRDYGPARVKGVDLLPTAYHDVVRALGGWGQQVTDREPLRDALMAAEASGKPACVNVRIRGEAAPRISR